MSFIITMAFKAITITETLLHQCHDGIATPTPGKHLVEIYSHFNIMPPKVLHMPCDSSIWSRYLSPALAELILWKYCPLLCSWHAVADPHSSTNVKSKRTWWVMEAYKESYWVKHFSSYPLSIFSVRFVSGLINSCYSTTVLQIPLHYREVLNYLSYWIKKAIYNS